MAKLAANTARTAISAISGGPSSDRALTRVPTARGLPIELPVDVFGERHEGAIAELLERAVADDLLSCVAAALAVSILGPGHPSLVAVQVQGQEDVCAVGGELHPEVAASQGDDLAVGRGGASVDLAQVVSVVHGLPSIMLISAGHASARPLFPVAASL